MRVDVSGDNAGKHIQHERISSETAWVPDGRLKYFA